MRPVVLFAVAALSLGAVQTAAAASIGPVSEIRISFGRDVENKPRVFGARERERLDKELRGEVEKAIGGLKEGGGVLDLVIEDVKQNRPTWTQMSFEPGLSYFHSFGVGGAKIVGTYTAASGATTNVGYSWYETDIRNTWYLTEWHDADRTFARFAKRLTEG